MCVGVGVVVGGGGSGHITCGFQWGQCIYIFVGGGGGGQAKFG